MKTGVALISYNRPEYLEKAISALELQEGCGDSEVEFYLYQDIPQNEGKTQKIIDCISAFEKSSLRKGDVVVRPNNYGVAMNHYEAYNDLFFHRGCEQIVVVEDDVVFNPDCLRLSLLMLEQFRYHNFIATVQASCLSGFVVNGEQREQLSDKLVVGKPNWLGFGLWKDRWIRIREYFDPYIWMVSKYHYQTRDNRAIRQWYRDAWGVFEIVTSQDRAKDWSCIFSGMGRVHTFVNRAVYIGEVGVHGTPQNFKSGLYHQMENTRIPSDKNRLSFEEVQKETVDRYIETALNQRELRHFKCS